MKKLEAKVRKEQILEAAMRLARNDGYQNVLRHNVAYAAQCSTGLVNKYYGTMTQLKRAMVREAINSRDLVILSQAIVARDPNADKASPELRQEALESLR